jgi:alanine-glyoxylate transaminase/serine-glyoxylate transaminase/serine-pyruvate transaminase
MGLHESLRKIVEEGLEKVWARHKMISDIIVSGMEEMGFSMLVEESIRLPELLTINLPEGVDDNTVRKKLLDEYGIEISAGLGPFAGKLWRIGVMGEGARKENADRILSAIRECIN